jgi:hypothetical protein
MPRALALLIDSSYVGIRKSHRRPGRIRAIGASCSSPDLWNEVHCDDDFQVAPTGPLPWFAYGVLNRRMGNEAIDPPGANPLPWHGGQVEQGSLESSWQTGIPVRGLEHPVAQSAGGEIERILDEVGLGSYHLRGEGCFRQVAAGRLCRVQALGRLAAGNGRLPGLAQCDPFYSDGVDN